MGVFVGESVGEVGRDVGEAVGTVGFTEGAIVGFVGAVEGAIEGAYEIAGATVPYVRTQAASAFDHIDCTAKVPVGNNMFTAAPVVPVNIYEQISAISILLLSTQPPIDVTFLGGMGSVSTSNSS